MSNRIIVTLLLAIVAPLLLFGAGNARAQDFDTAQGELAAMHPLLADELAATDAPVSFLVFLDTQADITHELQAADAGTSKRELIYRRLTAHALQSQAPLRTWLDERDVVYRPFYLVNMIEVQGDAVLAEALRRHPDVDRLLPNPLVDAGLATASSPQWLTIWDGPPGTDEVQATAALPYGLTYTNADDVWALGYTGQDIVIGDQDTGVQWDHNALKLTYRGWISDTQSVDHVRNWFDPWGVDGRPARCSTDPQTPCDDHGHGTHTVGTLMGDATDDATVAGGTRIGMAPDARWIGCRNMRNGFGTPASYTACFEFFLAPYPQGGDPLTDGDPSYAPHIISNSWACPPSEGCDKNSLRTIVETVRAAGQWVIASAGNAGSACSTVENPIAIHDATTSIGAHSSSGSIANFSSRGPVTADGSGRLKPDLSAPGVSVYSTWAPSSYRRANGTSMAAPHVAGAAALLWSAVPSLVGDVDLSEQVLIKSATPVPVSTCSGSVPVSPNNVYGYGRLDVLAAVNMALSPGSVAVTLLDIADQPVANETVTLVDRLTGFAHTESTGSDGIARFQTIFSGDYTTSVPANIGFPPADTSVPAAQDVQLTLRLSGPLTVTLAGHSLRWTDGQVVVEWETIDESGLAGFHVMRHAGDEAWTQLTDELLPANGVFQDGTYQFVDTTAPAASQLTYALRLLHIDGRDMQTELGSVMTILQLFMPFVE